MGKKLMGWLPVSYLYLANILYAMAVLINLMGCTWLFTAETEGSDRSWLIDVGTSSPPPFYPTKYFLAPFPHKRFHFSSPCFTALYIIITCYVRCYNIHLALCASNQNGSDSSMEPLKVVHQFLNIWHLLDLLWSLRKPLGLIRFPSDGHSAEVCEGLPGFYSQMRL